MSWDDLGTGLLEGTGPDVMVIDSDGNPNHILDTDLENKVQVDWSFSGSFWPGLFETVLAFKVSVYAESIGPGPELRLGSVDVAPGQPLTATISIPAGKLPSAGPTDTDPSGVYRLTTVISTTISGARTPVEGFHEGPTVEMRKQ